MPQRNSASSCRRGWVGCRGSNQRLEHEVVKRILFVLVLVALSVCGYRYYEANRDFTPWMTGAELDKFCADHEGQPPNNHPNFWDKGHWVEAVEGRWHNGVPQYRVRVEKSPKGKGGYYWWYWYFNQDQQSFSLHVHELADKGFTLLDPNSFLRPDDTRRYQGVWHKVQTKAEHDAESALQAARGLGSLPQTPSPLPPGSTSETPAFEVVDAGTKLHLTDLAIGDLNRRCSVFLLPTATPRFSQLRDAPSGMFAQRGNVEIVNGVLMDLRPSFLLIHNRTLTVPIQFEEIDYINVAK